MRVKYTVLFCSLIGLGALIIGASPANPNANTKYKNLEILFYNVENLFDTIDDPQKNDDEFLPGSEKQWNSERYHKKLDSLVKVIQGTLEINHGIIGLVEIENRQVLEDLVNHPLLKFRRLQIIHHDSPDERGIDVALLLPPQLRCDSNYAIGIEFPENKKLKTRDILMARIHLNKKPFWISVNHFPSRRGGEEASRRKRAHVASVLRGELNKLQAADTSVSFIIMGDFNDEPMDSSLSAVLGAGPEKAETDLVNLMWNFQERGYGSYRYKEDWNMLDQIIVSRKLLSFGETFVSPNSARIYVADYLVEQEGKFKGNPWRTYAGNKYLGGFSDHLPVLVSLRY